jgi:RIO kinase 1
LDQGVIQDVIRPLLSGKEAQIYLVTAGDEQRVAKVYKEAHLRSFKHRSQYTEGREVRSSRDQRAMTNRSRYGRAKLEAAWRSTEVDIIHRLDEAGVRVPKPFAFVDNVLVMELITDAAGNPAPRLADVSLTSDQALAVFERLLREAVRMLCAGVIHGDLSDFNVLMGADGPALIDFPQAVDAAKNQNARRLLVRDIDNLTRFGGRFHPRLRGLPYGQEIWDAYERGQLTPTIALTGRYRPPPVTVNTGGLLAEIEALERENRARREALGLPPARPARQPREVAQPARQHGSQHAPPHASQHASQHAPQHASQHAPQHASQHAPQHASQHAPQHASRHAPQHSPQHTRQQAQQRPGVPPTANAGQPSKHRRRRRHRGRGGSGPHAPGPQDGRNQSSGQAAAPRPPSAVPPRTP